MDFQNDVWIIKSWFLSNVFAVLCFCYSKWFLLVTQSCFTHDLFLHNVGFFQRDQPCSEAYIGFPADFSDNQSCAKRNSRFVSLLASSSSPKTTKSWTHAKTKFALFRRNGNELQWSSRHCKGSPSQVLPWESKGIPQCHPPPPKK